MYVVAEEAAPPPASPKLGINDLQEFAKTKASFDEMLSMNSYFFDDLNQLRDKDTIDK